MRVLSPFGRPRRSPAKANDFAPGVQVWMRDWGPVALHCKPFFNMSFYESVLDNMFKACRNIDVSDASGTGRTPNDSDTLPENSPAVGSSAIETAMCPLNLSGQEKRASFRILWKLSKLFRAGPSFCAEVWSLKFIVRGLEDWSQKPTAWRYRGRRNA